MLADYVCAVNPNHRSSFGEPQTPPPECCGKPMTLEQAALHQAQAAQPAAAATPPKRAARRK